MSDASLPGRLFKRHRRFPVGPAFGYAVRRYSIAVETLPILLVMVIGHLCGALLPRWPSFFADIALLILGYVACQGVWASRLLLERPIKSLASLVALARYMLWGVPITVIRVSLIVFPFLFLALALGDDWREDSEAASDILFTLLIASIVRVVLGPAITLIPSAKMTGGQARKFILSSLGRVELVIGHGIIFFSFLAPAALYGAFWTERASLRQYPWFSGQQFFELTVDIIAASLFVLMAGVTAVYRAQTYLAWRSRGV